MIQMDQQCFGAENPDVDSRQKWGASWDSRRNWGAASSESRKKRTRRGGDGGIVLGRRD